MVLVHHNDQINKAATSTNFDYCIYSEFEDTLKDLMGEIIDGTVFWFLH